MVFYNYMAIGFFSVVASIIITSIFATFFVVGDSFARFISDNDGRLSSTPTKIVMGALLSNMAFFVATLTLPFGLLVDWIIVVVAALLIWFGTRSRRVASPLGDFALQEMVFVVMTTLVVMIWCRTILHPIETTGEIAIIRAWPDVYYHLSQIGSLANSTGLASMSDLQMADSPIHPYHIASYIFPALIVKAANIPAWAAYGGFYVPFGTLLTALAAYSLANAVFGKWPALASGLAVLLIPDAFQQGFGNQFMGGYYWLQHIAPAGNFGVTCAAVSFVFLFEACRTGKLMLVAVGYLLAFATLMFKAQVFVAISSFALLFPVLFMPRFNSKHRIALAILLAVIYFCVLELSQRSSGMPVMRINGTGLFPYSSLILKNQGDGVIRTFGLWAFSVSSDSWVLRASAFICILIATTFGVLPLIYMVIVSKMKRSHHRAVWLFPIFVVAVYLVMATSLALDTRHIGTPEELLHRPFVWAFYILAIWCSGSAYKIIFGNAAPRSGRTKFVVVGLIVCLLYIPVMNSGEISKHKGWEVGFQQVPACQLNVARYISVNSGTRDIIQDSLNDPLFILTGLSERQAFAIDAGGIRAPSGVQQRLASLKALKTLDGASQVESFMRQHEINWYVMNPGDSVKWLDLMSGRKVYQCDRYSVYHF